MNKTMKKHFVNLDSILRSWGNKSTVILGKSVIRIKLPEVTSPTGKCLSDKIVVYIETFSPSGRVSAIYFGQERGYKHTHPHNDAGIMSEHYGDGVVWRQLCIGHTGRIVSQLNEGNYENALIMMMQSLQTSSHRHNGWYSCMVAGCDGDAIYRDTFCKKHQHYVCRLCGGDGQSLSVTSHRKDRICDNCYNKQRIARLATADSSTAGMLYVTTSGTTGTISIQGGE